MQAYRRLASTATSSTSRSASHASHTQGQSSRLSRSSSSIASVSSSSSIASATTALTMTAPTDSMESIHAHGPFYAAYSTRSPTSPSKSVMVPRSSMAGTTRSTASHFGSETPRPSRAEIQTIAEGLLAHVNFPYHLASSPQMTVSSIHTHLGHHEKSASMSAASNGSTSGFFLGGPSSRRHFAESAERGRGGRSATTVATASGRGRGGRTKGLSLGIVDESIHDDFDPEDLDFDFSLEDGERRDRRGRDREGRGRNIEVKGLHRCLS